jgi:hypothetical protein
MPYINLFGREDRLGGNITIMLSQILYAVNNDLCIMYNKDYIENVCGMKYNSSIFMLSLYDFIDKYNEKHNNTFDFLVDIKVLDYFHMLSQATINIKTDLISFFENKIYSEIRPMLIKRANEMNYTIPFDPKKTILVHLRLDDVRNIPDYDGRICANFFRQRIDNDEIINTANTHDVCNSLNRYKCQNSQILNHQSPLSPNKVKEQINLALAKYSDRKVIIITNPGENISDYPYDYICSDDPSYDLFLLCNSEVIILSRSTYSVSALFFGIAKEAYVPLWGHIPCYGLYTKYDNKKYNYFY